MLNKIIHKILLTMEANLTHKSTRVTFICIPGYHNIAADDGIDSVAKWEIHKNPSLSASARPKTILQEICPNTLESPMAFHIKY